MGRGASSPADFRNLNGILILDKELGLSSNRALQDTRYLFKAKKAGHTGSLDPLASGVLPICFGEATKFSSYILNASKKYRAHCRLGKTSSTGDAEGEIIEQAEVTSDHDDIARVLRQFVGNISQIPPMYSALKHQGKKLYELARQGKQVERKARDIEIFAIELVSFDGATLVLDVHCSKGTYIRTLAEDIGQALGCGAYLTGLCRTGAAPFWQQSSYSMERLKQLAETGQANIDALLLPVSAALGEFPQLELTDSDSQYLQQGLKIPVKMGTAPGLYRLFSLNACFIGLGEVTDNASLKAKRLMNTSA